MGKRKIARLVLPPASDPIDGRFEEAGKEEVPDYEQSDNRNHEEQDFIHLLSKFDDDQPNDDEDDDTDNLS